MILFVYFFLRAPNSLYNQAQAREKQAQQQSEQLRAELEKEKDRSSPKFEIEWVQPIVSDMVEIKNGTSRRYTMFFVQVSVYNRGIQSVVRGWKLNCKFSDGTELNGDSYMTDRPLTFHTSRGPFTFKSSSSLSARTSDKPIPTNGRIPGYLFFRFSSGLRNKMTAKGTVFSLTIFDINMNPYLVKIPWDSMSQTAEEVRIPSVD